jgi:hypothetical protein
MTGRRCSLRALLPSAVIGCVGAWEGPNNNAPEHPGPGHYGEPRVQVPPVVENEDPARRPLDRFGDLCCDGLKLIRGRTVGLVGG